MLSSGDIISGSNVVSGADVSAPFTIGTVGVIVIALVIFAIIMILLELLRSRYVLTVNRQFITMDDLPEPFDGTKIALISDLHQMRFGEYNEELAKRIRREKPGYIFFAGDMGDSVKYDVDAFYDLLEALGGDIKMLMTPGDHDLRLGGGVVHKNFLSEVQRAGAVMLNNSCAELVADGKKLYVYGFCQPLTETDRSPREWELSVIERGSLNLSLGKCPSDAPVILLAHDPSPFPEYARWGASLVLSGHEHGGLVRLPFLGGVLAVGGGFKPVYSAGIYHCEKSKMFVSRGLGSSGRLRFLNAPEIAILTLVRPDSKLLEEQAKSKVDVKAGFRFAALRDWFAGELRSSRDLIDERLNQTKDFFALMFGKKRDRFAKAADEKKRRNTYIAPDSRKQTSRNKKPTRYISKDNVKKN